MNFAELMVIALSLASAATALLVLFFVLKGGRREREAKPEGLPSREAYEGWALRVERSVSPKEAEKAREELRILGLEQEILGDAIRKLYEAHAEGKITEDERELLAAHYKERMLTVKEAISKNESIVALHELEVMQEDLIKLFNERFDELNRKIEELRTRVQVKTVEEVRPVAMPVPAAVKVKGPQKARKARRRPRVKVAEPRKTEAERRIEEIRAEVEKVLARLGQMEIEA